MHLVGMRTGSYVWLPAVAWGVWIGWKVKKTTRSQFVHKLWSLPLHFNSPEPHHAPEHRVSAFSCTQKSIRKVRCESPRFARSVVTECYAALEQAEVLNE